jgi:hypothetical protein
MNNAARAPYLGETVHYTTPATPLTPSGECLAAIVTRSDRHSPPAHLRACLTVFTPTAPPAPALQVLHDEDRAPDSWHYQH